MTNLLGNTIADAAAMGPRYAKRLVHGIPSKRFARFAAPAGECIVANHPAFIMGHLCLYPIKVVELLGGDTRPGDPAGKLRGTVLQERYMPRRYAGHNLPTRRRSPGLLSSEL